MDVQYQRNCRCQPITRSMTAILRDSVVVVVRTRPRAIPLVMITMRKSTGHFRVLVPLFQNESKCKTFHMKTSSACGFIFMKISHFHKNGFARRLALKQRQQVTGNGLFRGFLSFPIWVWCSAREPFGPPELRHYEFSFRIMTSHRPRRARTKLVPNGRQKGKLVSNSSLRMYLVTTY